MATEVELSAAERIERLQRDGLGLLSVREAAAYLGPGFSPRWVEDQVYAKKDPIPSFMVGGKRVIAAEELLAWVKWQRHRDQAKRGDRG